LAVNKRGEEGLKNQKKKEKPRFLFNTFSFLEKKKTCANFSLEKKSLLKKQGKEKEKIYI
jgi:hypothetical protein